MILKDKQARDLYEQLKNIYEDVIICVEAPPKKVLGTIEIIIKSNEVVSTNIKKGE